MELAFACASSVGFVMPVYHIGFNSTYIQLGWRVPSKGSLNSSLKVSRFFWAWLCMYSCSDKNAGVQAWLLRVLACGLKKSYF
jgi:hypothetical protein